MAMMTKTPKGPSEGALIPVERDADVLAAGEIARTLQEREQALVSERHTRELAANPNNFGSADHRIPLTEPELIAAHDRLQAIAAELRQLRVERPAAEDRLRAARQRAYAARFAAARVRVVAKLQLLYRALDVAAGTHAELMAEVAAMNEVLRVPGAAPAFPPSLLSPEFLEGGIHAERRRHLAADGWLAAE